MNASFKPSMTINMDMYFVSTRMSLLTDSYVCKSDGILLVNPGLPWHNHAIVCTSVTYLMNICTIKPDRRSHRTLSQALIGPDRRVCPPGRITLPGCTLLGGAQTLPRRISVCPSSPHPSCRHGRPLTVRLTLTSHYCYLRPTSLILDTVVRSLEGVLARKSACWHTSPPSTFTPYCFVDSIRAVTSVCLAVVSSPSSNLLSFL